GEVAGFLFRDPAVEANDSRETLSARCLVEGDPAAETKANREHGGGFTTLRRSDVGDAGGDGAADVLVGRLLEMRLVIEIIFAAFDSRRPPVVVDDHGVHASVAEPERKLLIEAVQAPDVGKDPDPWCVGGVGRRGEGGETIPVHRFEDNPSSVAALPGREWRIRPRVGV